MAMTCRNGDDVMPAACDDDWWRIDNRVANVLLAYDDVTSIDRIDDRRIYCVYINDVPTASNGVLTMTVMAACVLMPTNGRGNAVLLLV